MLQFYGVGYTTLTRVYSCEPRPPGVCATGRDKSRVHSARVLWTFSPITRVRAERNAFPLAGHGDATSALIVRQDLPRSGINHCSRTSRDKPPLRSLPSRFSPFSSATRFFKRRVELIGYRCVIAWPATTCFFCCLLFPGDFGREMRGEEWETLFVDRAIFDVSELGIF